MSDISIAGADFSARMPARGKTVFTLAPDGTASSVQLERVGIGKFNELSALERERRLHRAGDALSVEMETVGVIPFGCEYEISRRITVLDGFALFTLDLKALNGGKIEDITLEPVEFSGTWLRIDLLKPDDPAPLTVAAGNSGTLYSGPEPPLALGITFAGGGRIEFYCGSDLWRHRAGQHLPGAGGEFTISATPDAIRLERHVLFHQPESEIERRPWRFKNFMAWRGAGRRSDTVAEATDFAPGPGCALNGIHRRALRKAVRRAAGSLRLCDCDPVVCRNPAHLDRGGAGREIEHFDFEEYVASYLWGNRQLRRCGRSFVCHPAAGRFAGWAALANLADAIRPLVNIEENNEK